MLSIVIGLAAVVGISLAVWLVGRVLNVAIEFFFHRKPPPVIATGVFALAGGYFAVLLLHELGQSILKGLH